MNATHHAGPAAEERLSVQEFRALLKAKGWMFKDVAVRWQISAAWLSRLAHNPERGAQWDDACRGLPDLRNATGRTR